MKNTHLEHPEDSVLLGKHYVQQVINFLRDRNSTVSVKWDGAPAIVFGKNPENGKFFVGTKSVFNKVKVKINYTHNDIEKNHSNNPKVAGILHTCLETLPKVDGIYQGDFIGFGGTNQFTPNTITYTFDSIPLDCAIVFACHTSYTGPTMKELTASFDVPFYLKSNFMKTYFVNTNAHVTSRRRRVDYILGLASVVSNFVKYPEGKKEQEQIKIAVNKCIRENRPVSDVLSDNLREDISNQVRFVLIQSTEPDEVCLIDGISTGKMIEAAVQNLSNVALIIHINLFMIVCDTNLFLVEDCLSSYKELTTGRVNPPHDCRRSVDLHAQMSTGSEPIKNRKITRQDGIFGVFQVCVFHELSMARKKGEHKGVCATCPTGTGGRRVCYINPPEVRGSILLPLQSILSPNTYHNSHS